MIKGHIRHLLCTSWMVCQDTQYLCGAYLKPMHLAVGEISLAHRVLNAITSVRWHCAIWENCQCAAHLQWYKPLAVSSYV